MKITVLVEDATCGNKQLDLKPELGLSIHVELGTTHILFDVGKTDRFIRNAKKLHIDLSKVDYLIISHGHFDHGGGLKYFLEINKTAKIFMHKDAVNEHFTKIFGLIPFNIGLDQKVIDHHTDRIVFIDKNTSINENIMMITDFSNHFPQPKGNLSLYKKSKGKKIHDDFKHEIALLINENDKSVLFTACSHSGIVNMYKKALSLNNGRKIDYVFGGFHTYNPATFKNESKVYIDTLTLELEKTNSIYYSGHCTGKSNLKYMQNKLPDKIYAMHTGSVIEI